jgi:hypothetical protein
LGTRIFEAGDGYFRRYLRPIRIRPTTRAPRPSIAKWFSKNGGWESSCFFDTSSKLSSDIVIDFLIILLGDGSWVGGDKDFFNGFVSLTVFAGVGFGGAGTVYIEVSFVRIIWSRFFSKSKAGLEDRAPFSTVISFEDWGR